MYKTKIPEIKSQRVLNEGKVNLAFMPYCSIPGEIEGLSIEISICPFPSGTLFRFSEIDTSDDSVDVVSTSYQFVPGTMMVACSDHTDTDIHLYDEAGFSVKSLRILFDENEAQWRPLSTRNVDKEEVEEDDNAAEDEDDENKQEEEFVDNSVEVIEPEQIEQEEPLPENNDNDDEDDEEQEPEPEPERTKEDKPHIRSIGARQETSRKEPMRREEPERKPERQKDDRRERQERRDNKGFNGTTQSQPQRQPQQNQRQRFDQRQKGNVQEKQQPQQQQPRRDNRPQEQQSRRDNNGGKGNRNDNRQQQPQRRTANVSKPSFDFSGIVKQAYSN